MATKIRLARHGKKAQPFYHIVVADSRAPRDGKFIEKIGTYNPISNPATVELDFDRALYWIQCGAQPTETASTLLRREGVLYMKHLLTGVRKGSFDEATAQVKFNAWKDEKEKSKENDFSSKEKSKEAEAKKRLDAEVKANNARIEKIAKKTAAANQAAVEDSEAATEEETAAE